MPVWPGSRGSIAAGAGSATASRQVAAIARNEHGSGDSALSALLRSRGYEPVEVEPGLVRLGNCPFADIAARHRTLICALNLALIEGLLAGLGT